MSSDALPDDPATLKAMLLAERVQNERLRQIIKELQRHRFGRRAETLPEDQMLLCSATIWMGTQRQSGWPFWRSRREDICRDTAITQAIFA